MSLAKLAPPTVETVAYLLESLGDVPPERIRMRPPPETATEDDVIAIHARQKRVCELVDGVLVEKPKGFDESRLALEIGFILIEYLRQHDVGTVAGEAGMMRLLPGLVRIPDVSFVRWEHLPEKYGPIPPIAPDLAVEVLSELNTPKEMERKLQEYFAWDATGLVLRPQEQDRDGLHSRRSIHDPGGIAHARRRRIAPWPGDLSSAALREGQSAPQSSIMTAQQSRSRRIRVAYVIVKPPLFESDRREG